MQVQVMSDLHVEFRRDHGREFFKGLPETDADVLVLAGDIGLAGLEDSLADGLGFAAERFKHVVCVSGNHEYYHGSPTVVTAVMDRLMAKHKNLHWLNKSACMIDGQRFLGATLWFPEPNPLAQKRALNDFHYIKGFEPWVYEEHHAAVKYLTANIEASDIVVTHHIPTGAVVAQRLRGSRLSEFYASNTLSLDVVGTPKMWFYGHTHDSSEQVVGGTRLVVNPCGYHGRETNPNFRTDLVFEV